MNAQWPLVGRTAEKATLVRAVARARSVILAGPAGVGKTRLVEEVVEDLSPTRVFVHRVIATGASSEVPFGALARVFSISESSSAAMIIGMNQARSNLLSLAADRQLLVWVDNANLLDNASVETLTQMAVSGEAQVVMTLRNDEPVPRPITMLWKDQIADRIEIEPLTESATRALVEAVLDGPVDRISCAAILQLAAGNPMFLRELLIAANEAGTLVRTDSLWTLRGPLNLSDRLNEVVEARLKRISVADRRALELVAVAEPIGIDVAIRVAGQEAVNDLETDGLITVESQGLRTIVRCTHPVHAEVVRSTIPAARIRSMRLGLAEELSVLGAKRDSDAIRVATWKVQSGCAVDPESGSQAARSALHGRDVGLARRLATAADPEHCFAAALVLGEIEFAEGNGDTADSWFQRAYALASTEDQKREAAVARGFNLFLMMHEWDSALEFLEEVEADLSDPRWKAEARAARAAMHRLRGQSGRALELAEAVLCDDAATDVGIGRALGVAHSCLVARGQFGAAIGYADRVTVNAGKLPELHIDEMGVATMHAVAIGLGSDLAEGIRLAREGYENAVAKSLLLDVSYWGKCLGELLLLSGAVGPARRVFEETAAAVRIADPLAMSTLVLAGAALVTVRAGDLVAAQHLINEATSADNLAAGRARAALEARNGNRLDAAQIAVESAERAFDRSDTAWGLASLHEAVRYGHPEIALPLLRRHSAHVEGPYLPLLLPHAEALVERDADQLEHVANEFERFGALMLAAEVLCQASLTTATTPQRARYLEARAVALFGRCEGAALPPILVDVHAKILTGRESEIAQLAAIGESSKSIAERLFISVRTVDNHLASVYGKLAVSGRRELATVFGLDHVTT